MLLLLTLLAAVIILRRQKYFIRRSTIGPLVKAVKQYKGRISFKKLLPYFLFAPAITLLIMAAADFSIGTQKKFKKYLVHNYILIDDSSGSMTNAGGHYDEEKDEWVQNKISENIASLIAGNKALLEELKQAPRESNERDLVGVVVFSNDAFVVSYPTSDYDNLAKKIDLVSWNQSPLGGGTEVEDALWVAITMIVKRNGRAGGACFIEGELDSLDRRMKGQAGPLVLTKELERKAGLIAQEINGTAFVIFTDGEFYDYGERADQLSTTKLLQFCQRLGIRVYLISTNIAHTNITLLIRKTGGRVEFIKSVRDTEKLKGIYADIAQQQAHEYVVEDKEEKKSLHLFLGIPGFCLLFLWLLVRNTVSRSLTES
ncbi:MAG: vWA domain-containing protein [Patescibacteria group bacterium]